MIICDKTTMNAAIIFIALSWFAIGYVVANARMINQAIEKGLAYRDSEGRFCWKEYYQLKREFEESKKMKKRKYYYNHPFPIDTMRNWLKYKDYHYIIWKGHLSIKELYGIELQPKRRHKRSFISCRLPKLIGNKVVYRLFKATRWFKEPNTKYRREEKYYSK